MGMNINCVRALAKKFGYELITEKELGRQITKRRIQAGIPAYGVEMTRAAKQKQMNEYISLMKLQSGQLEWCNILLDTLVEFNCNHPDATVNDLFKAFVALTPNTLPNTIKLTHQHVESMLLALPDQYKLECLRSLKKIASKSVYNTVAEIIGNS